MKTKSIGWRIIQLAVPVIVFASCCNAQAQGTLTRVTFDGPPSFLSGDGVRQYYEANVSFIAMTDPNGYGWVSRRLSGASSDYPYNGTAYIQGSPFAPILVAFAGGAPFGLFSVDLAEHNMTTPNALTVQFVGYFADGSSVMNSFTTDGIIGVPGTPDFQTFFFGPEFSRGLTRVEIPPTGASLDNLVVTVPEPSTWLLLLLGWGILGLRRFKRTQGRL